MIVSAPTHSRQENKKTRRALANDGLAKLLIERYPHNLNVFNYIELIIRNF